MKVINTDNVIGSNAFKKLVATKLIVFYITIVFVGINSGYAQGSSIGVKQYVTHTNSRHAFRLAAGGQSAQIIVDHEDWKGVIRAANDLGDDVRKVTGKASLVSQSSQLTKGVVVVGTIGKSKFINALIANGKLDVSAIKNKWESYLIQTVGGNLIVAGSDKRGTIYGIYDLSEKIGVSPWYWWADAPVKKSSSLFINNGRYVQKSPKVKFRGIFINDESPSMSGWSKEKFGSINSKMYVHMFELLLRLKANLLWPAMWGNAFNEDDPQSPVLADEYGIVMGTSHHEPMMRAQKEYTKLKSTVGPWNYTSNEENLNKFWQDGLKRNKNFDNLVTVGMRGDGDVAMGEGDDEANIKTLHKVVANQQKIIKDVYGQSFNNVPQAWAIFTEVQRYYDAGFNVPDDVTLLFCDNNWGYIRRTGPSKEQNRKGGLGLYYHIDMNGGPWNDRWINTTTIPKLREQLNLAYQTGINREWIINVGDLKPKELPIDFIMHYAWDPDAIPAGKTTDYTVAWAESIFGKDHAVEIADIVSKYSKYNLLRKPEVQHPDIFSFVNYHEVDRVYKLWSDLVTKAEQLERQIPVDSKDAFFQLVLYPAKASAGVAKIYLNAGRNQLYAKQGRISANDYAKQVRDLFELDKQLSNRYNDTIAGGKWKNMMSDVHIGYKQWSMPLKNELPELKEVIPLKSPTMGIAVEGSELAWPANNSTAELPLFDVLDKQQYFIDIFNRGAGNFQFTATANRPWIKLSTANGTVGKEQRLFIHVDWKAIPKGENTGMVEIQQGNVKVPVTIKAINVSVPLCREVYFGGWGEFSVPAYKFSKNIPQKDARWTVLPDLGRSIACMGITPVTAKSATPKTAPRLEYQIFLPAADSIKVCLGILPTQDVNPRRGLRIAVSIDDQVPQVIDARKGFHDEFKEYTAASLAISTNLKPLPALGKNYALVSRGKQRRDEIFDNMRWLDLKLGISKPGMHTLKVYMIDPEVVLETIVVNPNDRYPSYFGAPVVEHRLN